MCVAESREAAAGNEVRKTTERPECAGLWKFIVKVFG